MANKLTARGQIRLLTFMGVFIYFASYLTRINYTTILQEFIDAEDVPRQSASLIATVALVTYGVGQLLSGLLGDHISPVRLIAVGMGVTVSMNLLLPFAAPHIGSMIVIWGVNGLAQAFLWPPLVKIFACALTHDAYDRAITRISIGSAGGTLATYLFAPLLIRLSGWRLVFYTSVVIGLVGLIVWCAVLPRLLRGISFHTVRRGRAAPVNESPQERRLSTCLMHLLPVMIATIAVQGMLRDGISTWTPTLLTDTFHMENTVSILVSVVLPIAHVGCNLIVPAVLRRVQNDAFRGVCVYYIGTVVSLLLLALFGTSGVVVSLACLMGVSGMAHSLNVVQTCILPRCFHATGRDSFFAGLLNASTYIGSALSTYLFALISDRFGWAVTRWSWVAVAAAGLALSAFLLLRVNRARREPSTAEN